MSPGPTQPGPEWWNQPQGPQPKQGHEPGEAYPLRHGYHDSQQTQRLPPNQDYQKYHDYQGTRPLPDQGYQQSHGYQAAPTRARRRRRWPLITLIVVLVLLVAADRGAKAYAENQMASQFRSSLDLSGKPDVNIQGFPFLTQLAARDFRTVTINASNETAGPDSQLEIASLTATLHGMHLNSLNSTTIDQFNASALITFTALAHAGGIPQGITLSANGPAQIKASIDILGFSSSAVAQVTQSGPNQINVHVLNAGGIPGDVLGSLANFNVSIPKLPAGVTLSSVDVTQQGLRLTAVGHDTTLSQ